MAIVRGLAMICLLALGACGPTSLADRPVVGSYEYRIGPGDKLKITTYGEARLSGDFAVGNAGTLAFPLLGDVPASGRTLIELRNELQARLGAQYLRDPQVTIEMTNYRPVYILGEVARPGEFPYSERLSLFAMVAKAGGFTYRASQSYVYIRGENETEEHAVRLSSATAVLPGDTIRIPERKF